MITRERLVQVLENLSSQKRDNTEYRLKLQGAEEIVSLLLEESAAKTAPEQIEAVVTAPKPKAKRRSKKEAGRDDPALS